MRVYGLGQKGSDFRAHGKIKGVCFVNVGWILLYPRGCNGVFPYIAIPIYHDWEGLRVPPLAAPTAQYRINNVHLPYLLKKGAKCKL